MRYNLIMILNNSKVGSDPTKIRILSPQCRPSVFIWRNLQTTHTWNFLTYPTGFPYQFFVLQKLTLPLSQHFWDTLEPPQKPCEVNFFHILSNVYQNRVKRVFKNEDFEALLRPSTLKPENKKKGLMVAFAYSVLYLPIFRRIEVGGGGAWNAPPPLGIKNRGVMRGLRANITGSGSGLVGPSIANAFFLYLI